MEIINPRLSGSIVMTGSLNVTGSITATDTNGNHSFTFDYQTGVTTLTGSISGSFSGELVDNTVNTFLFLSQSSAPADPVDGHFYADDSLRLRFYSASAWHTVNLI